MVLSYFDVAYKNESSLVIVFGHEHAVTRWKALKKMQRETLKWKRKCSELRWISTKPKTDIQLGGWSQKRDEIKQKAHCLIFAQFPYYLQSMGSSQIFSSVQLTLNIFRRF